MRRVVVIQRLLGSIITKPLESLAYIQNRTLFMNHDTCSYTRAYALIDEENRTSKGICHLNKRL